MGSFYKEAVLDHKDEETVEFKPLLDKFQAQIFSFTGPKFTLLCIPCK